MNGTDQTPVQDWEGIARELKQQLLQAQKLGSAGALAASITHEFNNILTTIINYAKLGLRHRDHETREKSLNKILAAGQRASQITTGMLAFVRNRNDQQEPTDLVRLVQDVLLLVDKDLQIHRVRLQTQFEPDVIANVNTPQLQQVLMNLIINARQSMENGGRLYISVRKSPDSGFAEIAIRDTGTGIPAESLGKIFDPFFSTKKTDKNGQGGTGVGLSFAREVIEAHHGRIRVESAPGQGTTFTLKLPLSNIEKTENPPRLFDTADRVA